MFENNRNDCCFWRILNEIFTMAQAYSPPWPPAYPFGSGVREALSAAVPAKKHRQRVNHYVTKIG
jgi:hypothetical protein